MKTTLYKWFLLFFIGFLISCGQYKSPFFDELLQTEGGHLRGIEIGATITDVKAKENTRFLKDETPKFLHYEVDMNMGNSYAVTYDFSEENKLFEIELAIFLDVIEDADVLFKDYTNYFNKKYKFAQKEEDGYITWHTFSSISGNKITISIANESDSYGFLTILVQDVEY